MADKLGLGPEIRELKIGSSFFNNKTEFHSLRYDFKPASVVSGSKNATIEIGSNQQVTVTHCESSGSSQTVFKGSRKPYQKECVLIIDRNTGEITLEKLTTNIQLKKTRPEGRPGGYNIGNSSNRPPTPVDKKHSPPMTSSTSSSGGRNNHSKNMSMSHPPAPHGHAHSHGHAKQSPRQAHQQSPQYNHRSSPLIIHKSPPQVSNLSLSPSPAASLPMIDDCNDNSSNSFDIGNSLNFPELRDSPEFNNFQEDVGVLSDSSSDSDSDSNSSDSDADTRPPPPPSLPPVSHSHSHSRVNGHVNGKSSSSSIPNHFLNEDLQLSESGSDSD